MVYPGGVTALYSFDFADRQQTLTVQRSGLPDQPVASAAVYQPSGPLADLQLGNGLTENRGFTSRYFPFPSNIQVNGASTILQWLYSTDAVGNILQITDGLDATQNRTLSPTARRATNWARQPTFPVLHMHSHSQPALVELETLHPPGGLDSQNLSIQLLIFHGSEDADLCPSAQPLA